MQRTDSIFFISGKQICGKSPCEQSPFLSTDVLDRALQESREIFVEHARGLREACARITSS